MKNLYLFVLLLSSISLFSSCDTEGEDTLDPGHYTIQPSFIYTSAFSVDSMSNYTVKFNDEKGNLWNPSIIARNNNTGKLEIYKVGQSSPVYSSAEMTITKDQAIQFIKLPGKQMAVYNADDYVSFYINIIYAGQADDYTATFNGMELLNGDKNYIKKTDGLTGALTVYEKGESNPIFTKEMTVEANASIKLLQLGTDFLSMGNDDEPDPISQQYTKIRFFYTQDAIPGVKTVQMIIYKYLYSDGATTPVGEPIEFNSDELSPYVTLDISNMNGNYLYIYDLIDKATDKKIVDNTINTMTYIGISSDYKKQTARITNATGNGGDNVVIQYISSLSTPW
jgi:hypothetical protein